jgi:hypothetical protein
VESLLLLETNRMTTVSMSFTSIRFLANPAKWVWRLGTLAILIHSSCIGASGSGLKYQPVVNFSTGAVMPVNFVVGDFNGDGKPDLAVPDYAGKTVSIYLNQDGGGFGTPVFTTLAINNTLGGILSGDFNEDGKADLVVATVAGDQYSIVLLGKGDGTFSVQPAITGAHGFISGKVADFNGDGHSDLFFGGGPPFLFLGQGNGSFVATSGGPVTSEAVNGSSAADFNGDNHLDGIRANYGAPAKQLGSIELLPGNASGTLGSANPFQLATIPNPGAIDVADFNGDGKIDLLVGGNGAAVVLFGNGDGTFQTESNQVVTLYQLPFPPDLTNPDYVLNIAADFDQDGKPDALVLDGTTGLLLLDVNDGTGKFPNARSTPYTFQLPPNGQFSMAAADFNGDGLPDIIVSNGTSKLISLLLSVKVLATPTVTLTSSGNTMLVGTSLKFKATVVGETPTATGTVSLLDGNSQVGQQSLDSTGSAVFNLSNLTAGTHTLSASYSGDVNYAAEVSGNLSQAVTDFQVAATTTSQTVSTGSTATYNLTVTPVSGFTGTVTVACSGLPALATCSAPSAQVGTSAATVAVVVTTVASNTAMAGGTKIVYTGFLLGCFSLWRLAGRYKSNAKWFVVLFPVVFSALAFLVAGCGGGRSKQIVAGTPSGTSTITITATSTQNGVSATHSVTATLVVQ